MHPFMLRNPCIAKKPSLAIRGKAFTAPRLTSVGSLRLAALCSPCIAGKSSPHLTWRGRPPRCGSPMSQTFPPETADTRGRYRVASLTWKRQLMKFLMGDPTPSVKLRCRETNMEFAPPFGRWVGWFVPRASKAWVNREAVNAFTRTVKAGLSSEAGLRSAESRSESPGTGSRRSSEGTTRPILTQQLSGCLIGDARTITSLNKVRW